MPDQPIHTLVVEDDPVLAARLRGYVDSVPGFVVSGVARSGEQVLSPALHGRLDLILLDFFLPDMSGLDVCRALRARGSTLDIIAVSLVRDLAMVQTAMSYGVIQYVVKPFTATAFRHCLERYSAFRRQITASPGGLVRQRDVDLALSRLRPDGSGVTLPKGLSAATLDTVVGYLRGAVRPLSADEVAGGVGLSRVTARRYLEWLAGQRLAIRTMSYGHIGRPRHLYLWRRP
ncbi:response regulator [Frankia sp. ACN1ag]|uniref:response regulator n=1 Tax=Frankia sp. ACN1ag TaxID=102891 RepID=UPI0006DC2215|nr:response regulator [Frankia sp. ACN1ag]KQC38956.1 chemotaxis protein CheY [Frankia sp. ACN1ag]